MLPTDVLAYAAVDPVIACNEMMALLSVVSFFELNISYPDLFLLAFALFRPNQFCLVFYLFVGYPVGRYSYR